MNRARIEALIARLEKTTDTHEKFWFTLPAGARELLDQLVDLQEVGGSHSEVIRYLVETQLQDFLDRGRLVRPKRKGK